MGEIVAHLVEGKEKSEKRNPTSSAGSVRPGLGSRKQKLDNPGIAHPRDSLKREKKRG